MSKTLAVKNGDFDINALGSIDTISGRDKLSQDFAEACVSDYDPSRDCGGKLEYLQVTNIGAKAVISGELMRIAKRLQAQQSQDPYLDADEELVRLGDVEVTKKSGMSYTFHTTLFNGSSAITHSQVMKRRLATLGHLQSRPPAPII